MSTRQNKESLLNNLDAIYFRTRNISKKKSILETGIKHTEGLKEMMSGFNTCSITPIGKWNGFHPLERIRIQ